MTAVIASTNIDKSTMDFAGVDWGAKIFVSAPPGAAAAEPAAAAIEQNVSTTIRSDLTVP
jgi:hypothetical protein